MNIDKQRWIEDTAQLYYRIFSGNYSDEFLTKLLMGGGGNSTLCGSWYQLSPVFVSQRISGKALDLLIANDFNIEQSETKVRIKKKYIDEKHGMFYNNAKGAKKRIIAGKLFHFDHNPSNKKILSLLNNRVKEYIEMQISIEDVFFDFSNYLKTIQTLDLITVEQDEIRTAKDREKQPLSSEDRDGLLQDVWYVLEIY